MIFNVFFAVLAFIVQGVAALLPSITIFPVTLSSNIATVVSSAYGWSWIFPVGTIITMIGILVIVVAAEFTFYAAMYVLKLIRG